MGRPDLDLAMTPAGRPVVLALALMTSVSHAAHRPVACGTERWQSFIAEASSFTGVPQRWIHTVMRVESAGCDVTDGRPTTSVAGAMGLMQLMPKTWRELKARLGLGDDPHDPHDNILAGAAYLRQLYDRYGSPGAFAAYHAGPVRYEEYLKNDRPLPEATLEYLTRLQQFDEPIATRRAALPPQENTSSATLFIAHRRAESSAESQVGRRIHDSLFVTRRHATEHTVSAARASSDVQRE